MIKYKRGDACLVLEGNGWIKPTKAIVVKTSTDMDSVYIITDDEINRSKEFGETDLENIGGWWLSYQYIVVVPRINKIGGKLL